MMLLLKILLSVYLSSQLICVLPLYSQKKVFEKPRHESYQASLYKPVGWHQLLNINNMTTWFEKNGEANHSRKGDSGTYYPRGTAWVIYKDGIKWGGKCFLDAELTQPAPFEQTIRVGGCDYGNGTREGRIHGFGANAFRADPNDPAVRMYRIRRDYTELSEEEREQEAADYFEKPVEDVSSDEIQIIIDQYDRDWKEWPVDLGAPFIDRNGNGIYEPPPPFSESLTSLDLIDMGYDEPGISDPEGNTPADQVLWNVFNDLDRKATMAMENSEPMGLEIQRLVWAYQGKGLEDIYFKRVRLINKGGVDIVGDGVTKGSFHIDSMYVGQWSDPDIGGAGDDLVGCDTLLNMGFAYNASNYDRFFGRYELPPPAVGYCLLQGPIVPKENGTAIFNFKQRINHENLGMTSFLWRTAGWGGDRWGYFLTLEYYNWLQGFRLQEAPKEYYPFPPGMKPGPFPLSGDPVAGTGFIDGLGETYSFSYGDRRFTMNTGPFTMAPGDTQEVVIAFICGIGADRLSSIAVMKYNVRFAQSIYNSQFLVPKAPEKPSVVATELDARVLLEWGSAVQSVDAIENQKYEPGGYQFEGYNLYQYPDKNATQSEGIRIATFDLRTDPSVIMGEYIELNSGQVLQRPIQYGSNSGIKRSFVFDQDYLNDVARIYNGQSYYLALTAYSRRTNDDYPIAALESEPEIIEVIPKVPFGVDYQTAYADTLDSFHSSGSSEGSVWPIVIDPAAVTGDAYEVGFTPVEDKFQWYLTNTSTGHVLLENMNNQSGNADYPMVDGLLIKVVGPELLGKSWQADPSSDRWFTGGGEGELLYGGVYLHPAYAGGSATASDAFKTVQIRFVEKTGYTDTNGSGTYDTGEPFLLPATGTQKAFFYLANDDESFSGLFDVPLTAWDIEDQTNPRQLNVIVLDTDENNQWDLESDSYPANVIWISDTDYDPMSNLHASPSMGGSGWPGSDSLQPGLWVLHLKQRGSREPYGASMDLTLTPHRINTSDDVFTFSTPASITGKDQEKYSADRVNVFPNPYYAYNPAEVHAMARFVTFNNLPPRATIRIFNLTGHLVMKLEKDDGSQFLRWDLLNHMGTAVASGLYIALVQMDLPSGGKAQKILKLAIIQEQGLPEIPKN